MLTLCSFWLWETLSLPKRPQPSLDWQWKCVQKMDDRKPKIHQFRTRMTPDVLTEALCRSYMCWIISMQSNLKEGYGDVRYRNDDCKALSNSRDLMCSKRLSSCTFNLKRVTRKHHTKHTPGILLYSRRQTVILIVAIWRKWRYTALKQARSYIHCSPPS